MSDVAILIPLWHRPHRVRPVYESALRATPDARVLFICSPDDDESIDAAYDVYPSDADPLIVDWPGGGRGDYAKKINAGYRNVPEPLLFTGADDLDFYPGWFDAARALIDVPEIVDTILEHGVLRGPKRIPRVGVVGTVDLCNDRTARGEHSTHSLVARWYADQGCSPEQGAMIYHEGYWHDYCDDELVGVAISREAYAHAHSAVVEHLHPNVRKADDDAVYRLGRAHSQLSRREFLRRRRMWLGPQQTSHTQFRRSPAPRTLPR